MNPNPGKKRTVIRTALLAGALIAITVGVWRFVKQGAAPPGQISDPPAAAKPEARLRLRPGAQPGSPLAATVQRLQTTKDPAFVRADLSELRKSLESLPPETAAETVRNFLDSKSDAPTQLPFKIGADGFLAESPSLRVFLLDLLAQLDPLSGAQYARRVLESPTDPDEWAVALRNVALGDTAPQTRDYLEQKFAEMLQQDAWVREPSTGFLEAFDVAVYVRSTNLVPALSNLVQKKDNPAAAHAAYLALDRLTIADPAATLNLLVANPGLLEGREATRANYFARADVRDGAQRRLLETYLLNPAFTRAELEQFAALYPSANFMVSRNLLTPVATPDHAWLKGRDAESLRVVQEWLADPRFARLKPDLESIRQRLESFARQVNRSP